MIKWTLRLSELVPSDQCFVLTPDPEKPHERTIVYSARFLHGLQLAYRQAASEATEAVYIPVDRTGEQMLIAFCDSKLKALVTR